MDAKFEKMLQNENHNLDQADFEIIEPMLNELAQDRQFDLLNEYINKIYYQDVLMKRCGYKRSHSIYHDSRDVNSILFGRYKLLIWSILFGHANVASYFFDKVYDVEIPGVLNRALTIAIENKQTAIVELLLDNTNNADLDSTVFFKQAVLNYDLNTIQTLLQDDRLDPTLNNNAVFNLACAQGYVGLVEVLLPYSRMQPIKVSPIQGGLDEALKNKHISIIKLLLQEESINPNTVLLSASKAGYAELVCYLLETNKNINPTTQRSLPLRMAVANNRLHVVLLFLKDGRAQPQALGNLALRTAASEGFTEIVSCLLVDPRVNPCARNNEAIRNAVKNYRLDTIKVLMAHKAVDLDVLVECVVHYQAPYSYSSNSLRYNLFKIIVQNERVNFEKALQTLNKGPQNCETPSIRELILLKVNFSLEQLMQNTRNKTFISNTLLKTLGIFSQHLFENDQPIPQDVVNHIGKLMFTCCDKA